MHASWMSVELLDAVRRGVIGGGVSGVRGVVGHVGWEARGRGLQLLSLSTLHAGLGRGLAVAELLVLTSFLNEVMGEEAKPNRGERGVLIGAGEQGVDGMLSAGERGEGKARGSW